MHLIELCAPNVAPATWPGVGSLSRSSSLEELVLALPHADCVLAHQQAPELPALLVGSTLPVVVCADQPSVAQAVACMRAGAVDVVPKTLAWSACQAALSQSMSQPKALGLLVLNHAQALEQERLELIGRLSWGLAHEILNPATFVMANLEETRACIQDLQPLLSYGVDLAMLHGNPAHLQAFKRQANWPEGLAELDGLIDECQEGMARINNLVNDIKSYGPTDQAERDLDLRRLLQRVLGLARKDLQALQVSVEIDRAPPVHASPARLASLLSSLLSALLKRPVSSSKRSLAIRSSLRSPWVELHLHDSAPLGADEDSVELARTQLGLAFGRELVARLQGELSIEGDAEGVHVRLRLPAELPGPLVRSGELLADARLLVHSPKATVRAHAADVLRCKTLHIVEQWPPLQVEADLALIPYNTEPIAGLCTLFLAQDTIPFHEMAAALAKLPRD
ncbi:MAG: signal transduction histidine kinase [Cognaticolwellia sp.]|jgi:signal transduction histidine kinase